MKIFKCKNTETSSGPVVSNQWIKNQRFFSLVWKLDAAAAAADIVLSKND